VAGKTRRLKDFQETETHASQKMSAIDMGMPRPWKIALWVLQKNNRIIFDISRPMTLGRMDPDDGVFPEIDLGPYNAKDLGVSREHLVLSLNGDRIVAMDKDSANGTLLNGEKLKPHEDYLIRDGDELTLGLLRLKVELLVNPSK
jgi:pSer/pThr/pTyr-binding forkhead associated (FHA) protein